MSHRAATVGYAALAPRWAHLRAPLPVKSAARGANCRIGEQGHARHP
jgi:hypothetical protein